MPLRSIPANEYRRVRWRNGGGWTREIASGRMPVESVATSMPTGDWDWRLSIAEIERDGPFSEFAGCDRVLVLLSGNGMRLNFTGTGVAGAGHVDANPADVELADVGRADAERADVERADATIVDLEPPHGRIAFAGERGVQCSLLDGPTTDFNAIVHRDRCALQVHHRPLVGSMVFFAEAGVLWAIHLLAGWASVKSDATRLRLQAGDTALLDNIEGNTSLRSILDGAGEALLVRIERRLG
ncbi:MAG: HutD family protein [Proteobacteria bacterium]|nr:HutD family protein [Pseudomonadota bacterium]